MAVTYKISEVVILICTASVVNSAPITHEPKTPNAVSKVTEYVLNLKRQEYDATPEPLTVFSELQDMEQEDIATATTEAKAERSTVRKSAQHNAKLENYSRTSATSVILISVLALSKPTPTVAKLEDITTTVKSRLYGVDEKFADFLRYIQSLLPAAVVFLLVVAFMWFFETYNYMCGRRLQEDSFVVHLQTYPEY